MRLNKNRASSECICMITFRLKLDGELMDLSVHGRLHFRAEKRDGKWGIVYFDGIYEQVRLALYDADFFEEI